MFDIWQFKNKCDVVATSFLHRTYKVLPYYIDLLIKFFFVTILFNIALQVKVWAKDRTFKLQSTRKCLEFSLKNDFNSILYIDLIVYILLFGSFHSQLSSLSITDACCVRPEVKYATCSFSHSNHSILHLKSCHNLNHTYPFISSHLFFKML